MRIMARNLHLSGGYVKGGFQGSVGIIYEWEKTPTNKVLGP
jgi:hypothetical protein